MIAKMLSYFMFGGLIVYAVLVRSLRYRRIEQTQKRYGTTPEEFKNLTYKDAQSIIGSLGLYECPWMFLAGKDFAFLRVSTRIYSQRMKTPIDIPGFRDPWYLQDVSGRKRDD